MVAVMHRVHSNDRGSALVVALFASLLLAGVGHGLILLTNTEYAIAANQQAGVEALYAADAALARGVSDIRRAPDWTAVLSGTALSGFLDGTRVPRLPSGETMDLDARTAELQAQAATDPWGPNNPSWRLFAYGPLQGLGGGIRSRAYAAVWVADDPAEVDGNPSIDSNRVLLLRVEAFGPHRAVRRLTATVGVPSGDLSGDLRPRVLSWREVR
jgi:hypothetical protein